MSSIVGRNVQITVKNPLSQFGLGDGAEEIFEGEVIDIVHNDTGSLLVKDGSTVRVVPLTCCEILIL